MDLTPQPTVVGSSPYKGEPMCREKPPSFKGRLLWGNPPYKVSPFRLVKTRAAQFDKKEPGTRIASRLSLVGRVVSFDWLKREFLISIKKSLERESHPDSVWWGGRSVSIG